MNWRHITPGSGQESVWDYPHPPRVEDSAGTSRWALAFYPSHMDACLVDGERVQSPPGDFHGGWITSETVGPFKGEPGTVGW